MSDVKVERKESLSRDEAANLLALLSRAFSAGDHADLPFGPSEVSLYIPDRVRAELEVEVEGDEVEVEIEFKWSMVEHEAGPAIAGSPAQARQGNGARKPTRSTKAHKRLAAVGSRTDVKGGNQVDRREAEKFMGPIGGLGPVAHLAAALINRPDIALQVSERERVPVDHDDVSALAHRERPGIGLNAE